ncbi:MAG: PilZ domain-containing protein [Magnetospiraceae bacterium]
MGGDSFEQKRKHKRWYVFEVGALYSDGGSAPCVIGNISAQGAKVSCELPLQSGENVVFELDGFGKIPAEVRHVDGTEAGLLLDIHGERQEAFVAFMDAMEKEYDS